MPCRSAEDLDLDVPRSLHVALDEDPPVPEARERLVRRAAEPFAHLVLSGRDPHPLAATPRRSLEHHRVADLAGDGHRLLGAGEGPVHPGDRVDPRVDGEATGFDLVPHRPDRGRRRADERDVGGGEGLDELGVLGQEPETGVHRVRAGGPRGLHHRVDDEIALRGRRGAHAHRRVHHPHVWRTFVRLGVDRRGGDPHPARGARDAAGDLAPVRDEDAFEAHRVGPPAPDEAAPRTSETCVTCKAGLLGPRRSELDSTLKMATPQEARAGCCRASSTGSRAASLAASRAPRRAGAGCRAARPHRR